uniref:hypothetical protein n=1 Tax=Pseudomonas fluorescens TaxID=294 RepID=UPI0018695D22|nr:hypothetical protein [Pseudomonas fluorescens]
MSIVRRICHFSMALIGIAIPLAIMLVIATMVATGKSRERTACLTSAQSEAQCPMPSEWETLLRRVTIPNNLEPDHGH